MKKFLKERKSGLFLIVFAFFVIIATSLGQKVQSSERTNFSAESQVENNSEAAVGGLDEMTETISGAIEGDAIEEVKENTSTEDAAKKAKEAKLAEEALAKVEAEKYVELKDNLKKYCDKKYNLKKCKKYLSEVKELAKKKDTYKKLYKKYHFEYRKKRDAKKELKDIVPTSDSEGVATKLVVTISGDSKTYNLVSQLGVNVIDLMNLAKISYDTLPDGRMDNIDGKGKEVGNMSWMLYLCKGSSCELAPVGAADCKIDADKICGQADKDGLEWRFIDWTTLW